MIEKDEQIEKDIQKVIFHFNYFGYNGHVGQHRGRCCRRAECGGTVCENSCQYVRLQAQRPEHDEKPAQAYQRIKT